jgi:hypothetical protein
VAVIPHCTDRPAWDLANLWLDLAPSQNRRLRQRGLLTLAAFALDNAIEIGDVAATAALALGSQLRDTEASTIHLQQPDA